MLRYHELDPTSKADISVGAAGDIDRDDKGKVKRTRRCRVGRSLGLPEQAQAAQTAIYREYLAGDPARVRAQ